MFTFEKKYKKLLELVPEYVGGLMEEDQKDAFEDEAHKWGYTIEELVYPYLETVTFTDLDAQTNFNNQLITMYQQEIQTMTIIYDDEVMISTQGMYNNKKSNFAGEDVYYGPTSKMSIPCDSCPLADTCKYECKAFTDWADEGVYWDTAGLYEYTSTVMVKDKNGKKVFVKDKNGKDKVLMEKVKETKWRESEVGVFKPNPKKVA